MERVPQRTIGVDRGVATSVLYVVFVLSGASATLFETLWFRLAGVTFGNSVWASSLVLASFMAGLALGSAWAARRAARVTRPIRVYALLEVTIALTGVGLVFALPWMSSGLASVFRLLASRSWPGLVDVARLAIAFAVLLVPATAMGATLPVLVRAMEARDPSFGRVLGRLYGWNTLGAAMGALLGELWLIERLGLRGTGTFAASLDLIAGAVALSLAGRDPAASPSAVQAKGQGVARSATPRRLVLAAAALSGAIALALEVVWFRITLLFVHSTSVVFALLLATVLVGIATGGLLAGSWLGRDADAHRFAPAVALACGAAVAAMYLLLALHPPETDHEQLVDLVAIARLAFQVLFVPAALSGVLFSLLGACLRREVNGGGEAVGALASWNTLGAMSGSLLGGFVLLPWLGMERSIWLLAAAYAAVAALAARASWRERTRASTWVLAGVGALTLLVLATFPRGAMDQRFFASVLGRFGKGDTDLVATRETLTETIQYLRHTAWDKARFYRLVTNGFSMSGTGFVGRRYMKLFVYLPVAIHPEPRRALLISYGVGTTARALVETRSLESIDVVDISRDIVDMSRIVYPGSSYPPSDPRVRVHVEDGRFFLATSDARFDIITSEPPPPKNAGVVNLYTRDYFELVRSRLAPGGMATYWLPIVELFPSDTKALVAAFCGAFADCALFAPDPMNWMLVGTRDAPGAVSESHFESQWRDPVVAAELRALGFETPESLGATFVADAKGLAALCGDQPPLDDDHPYRLRPRMPKSLYAPFLQVLDIDARRARFEASDWVRRYWPDSVRARTLDHFEEERWLESMLWAIYRLRPAPPFSTVATALEKTRLVTVPLVLLDSDPELVRIAREVAPSRPDDPSVALALGVDALSRRDYAAAERDLSRVRGRGTGRAQRLRVLAAYLDGRSDVAANLAREVVQTVPDDPSFMEWLQRTPELARRMAR